MTKRAVVLLLSLTVIFYIGCSKDKSTSPTKIDEFALLTAVGDLYFGNYTTASGAAVNISAQDLFTNLQDGNTANDPLIIDYRSATDFATGRIRGAINVALSALVDKINDGTITGGKTVVNVCYTGQTASVATSFLNMMGFEAQNLLWGMCGVTTDPSINGANRWPDQIAADEFANQLTAAESTPTQVYSFPEPGSGAKTAEDIMKARFATAAGGWSISATDVFANPAQYFIVNYWPKAEYLDPGHIPGSYCFEPKTSLKSDAMLKYLPTDKTIVVYCYSGQTSAQLCGYLQMLGYSAKSLLYGVNGFAYAKLTKSKYVAPVNDYSAIIVK